MQVDPLSLSLCVCVCVCDWIDMQVALNAPEAYEGGELIYANAAGLHRPPRPAGSATVHGAGVTPNHGRSHLWAALRF